MLLKSGGKVVCAMDVVFGLPRKRSAGIIIGTVTYFSRSAVNQIITDDDQSKTVSTVSHNNIIFFQIPLLIIIGLQQFCCGKHAAQCY